LTGWGASAAAPPKRRNESFMIGMAGFDEGGCRARIEAEIIEDARLAPASLREQPAARKFQLRSMERTR
jgi:hypothetical protein